jgi:tetratricopeptide (TPR) repeat protein
MRCDRTKILIGLVLVLGTLAVYGGTLSNEFVNYDDPDYVTANPNVQAGLTNSSIRWAFTTTRASNWHPLTWLSLQLDSQLFHLRPWGFHLTSLLLHCANALLLFLVLDAMTGMVWRSAVVAALFAWHPLHVESVAWVAERKDVLSTLFWMLTLGAYVHYVRRPGTIRYLLVFCSLGLGLMAKPMLVTLPCVLLLLDYWPLGRLRFGDAAATNGRPASKKARAKSWQEGSLRWLLIEKLPLFALAAASCAITWYVQQKGGAVQSLTKYPLEARLSNVPVAYCTYLAKMVLPVDLAPLYPHSKAALPAWQVAGASAFLLGVTALALALARRLPYLAVGWFWYLGTLVPVLGLVQVGAQALADRYTYVPLIGIFLLLVWTTADLLVRWRSSFVLIPATAVVLLFCMFLTWVQVGFWQNSYMLWVRTLAVTEGNYIARNNLALVCEDQGDLAQALTLYREAVDLAPDDLSSRINLAGLLARLGRGEEAVAQYDAALRIDPRSLPAHDGMGLVCMQLGRKAEAWAHFATMHQLKADSLAAEGHFDKAVELLRQARHLASSASRSDLVQKIEHRLRAYERRQLVAEEPATNPPKGDRIQSGS